MTASRNQSHRSSPWGQSARVLAFFLILAGSAQEAPGQDATVEEALSGFTQQAAGDHAGPTDEVQPPSPWQTNIRMDLLTAVVPFDHQAPSAPADSQGFSDMSSRLQVSITGSPHRDIRLRIGAEATHDLIYTIRDSDRFTRQQQDDEQWQAALGETWLDFAISSHTSLRLGRQLISWSRCDLFRPADVFAASDLRNPGVGDPAAARLPSDLINLTGFHEPWRWQLLVQPRPRFDIYPAYGDDFYPFSFPLPPRQSVSTGLSSFGWGILAARDDNGWGTAFHAASYVEEQELIGLTEQVRQRPLQRIVQIGMSGETARGSMVVKWDAVLARGARYYADQDDPKTRIDVALGTDYCGLQDWWMTAELFYRQLLNLDDTSSVPELERPSSAVFGIGIAARRMLFEDRLQVDLSLLRFGLADDHGGLYRAAVTWYFNDTISLTGGYVHYRQADNIYFDHLDRADRLFMQFSFSL